jgi:hypothetical protein
MSKKKMILTVLLTPLLGIGIYVGFIFGVDNFAAKPTGRVFPDTSCKVDGDCKAIDCTNINQGVSHCDQNGVPVCNGEKICACSYACL